MLSNQKLGMHRSSFSQYANQTDRTRKASLSHATMGEPIGDETYLRREFPNGSPARDLPLVNNSIGSF